MNGYGYLFGNMLRNILNYQRDLMSPNGLLVALILTAAQCRRARIFGDLPIFGVLVLGASP